jgi:redox-sensing transcriptional repressor
MNTNNDAVSPKTVERLSLYRRYLLEQISAGNEHIFSRQLALCSGGSPAQVRQDLRVLGYSGSSSEGYHIPHLLLSIDKFFSLSFCQKAVLAGVGNLGRALLSHFSRREIYPQIIAVVDVNPQLLNTVICGCRCFHPDEITEIIRDQEITMGILTVPAKNAQQMSDLFVEAGIKGILNFTPSPIRTPDSVYMERIDLSIALEKVAYYTVHYAHNARHNQ